jgi:D-alanyl-D-alanine carboxypeptidase/D-alanyl-D-alanine-endopeptidase (penicillin-binding protein 4)
VAAVTVLASLSPALAIAATNAPAASTIPELQERLQSYVSQPRFDAALWGIKAVSLDSGKTLFEHNPQKLFSPASNSKLYTVAMALSRLGTDYRIKTSLYTTGRADSSGVLNGDLVVYGRGDPTINARVHGNDVFQALEPLVATLTNAGIKRVTGNLVADTSFIHGEPWGSGWDWQDAEDYYGAEISALTFNDNYFQLIVKPGAAAGGPCLLELAPPCSYITLANHTTTTDTSGRSRISTFRPLERNTIFVGGSMGMKDSDYSTDVTCHAPAGVFLYFMKEAMAKYGIAIGGNIVVPDPEDPDDRGAGVSKASQIGHMESLPMSDIAREIMKPSQNLYTDLILAQVGEQQRNGGTPWRMTSESLGIRELNRFLGEAGVKSGDVHFEEGSGLSRNNLTTPRATVALLAYASKQPYATVYRDALPVAGVDGTLRRRLKGTPAENNMHAKTGTLRWAISLSGYVTTAGGDHLAFSIMLNRYPGGSSEGRADVDEIATMLASCTAR